MGWVVAVLGDGFRLGCVLDVCCVEGGCQGVYWGV